MFSASRAVEAADVSAVPVSEGATERNCETMDVSARQAFWASAISWMDWRGVRRGKLVVRVELRRMMRVVGSW